MQALGFVVGVIILAVSFLLGFFVLAAILGFGLIAAGVFYVRLWWLRRQMRRRAREESVLETEYRVVRETDKKKRRG